MITNKQYKEDMLELIEGIQDLIDATKIQKSNVKAFYGSLFNMKARINEIPDHELTKTNAEPGWEWPLRDTTPENKEVTELILNSKTKSW